MYSIIPLLAIASVSAFPTSEYDIKQLPNKPYSFSYGVSNDYDGLNFSRDEKSDGHQVKGSYVVQLPDGRKQIVNYHADHTNGFNADITYEGEAKYPSGTGQYNYNYNHQEQPMVPSFPNEPSSDPYYFSTRQPNYNLAQGLDKENEIILDPQPDPEYEYHDYSDIQAALLQSHIPNLNDINDFHLYPDITLPQEPSKEGGIVVKRAN